MQELDRICRHRSHRLFVRKLSRTLPTPPRGRRGRLARPMGTALSCAEGSTCPQWAQPVHRDGTGYRFLRCGGSSTSAGSSSGLVRSRRHARRARTPFGRPLRFAPWPAVGPVPTSQSSAVPGPVCLRRFLAAVLRIVRVRSTPSSPSVNSGACGAGNVPPALLRRLFPPGISHPLPCG